jgi:mannose-6-phosphate isomerase-like protein (cupin superfamily)
MAGYTKVNLKDEVDDQAPNFGLEGKLEARMARVPLELEHSGVSYQRIAPNYRVPFAHRHKNQEEVYILLSGSLRVKLEDEILELRPFDAIRVHKDTMRGFEGGPEGAELIAVGAPNTGPGDAEVENGWWD